MNRKVLLAAFNGESMCFVHVLLNALDMHDRGYDVKVLIEGSATRVVQELDNPEQPFANLYGEVRNRGLIDCVCRACAAKMGSLESASTQGLPLCSDMKGHPSLAKYLEQGFEIITF